MYADKVLRAQNLNDNLRAKALELKGDALLGEKRPIAAIESYQALLHEFEGKRPLGSIRYKVGQLLFERGDVRGAENVWENFKAAPTRSFGTSRKKSSSTPSGRMIIESTSKEFRP